MEEQITLTKSELVAAFKLWDEEYSLNPEVFKDIKESDPEGQAELILEYLNKVRNK